MSMDEKQIQKMKDTGIIQLDSGEGKGIHIAIAAAERKWTPAVVEYNQEEVEKVYDRKWN